MIRQLTEFDGWQSFIKAIIVVTTITIIDAIDTISFDNFISTAKVIKKCDYKKKACR